MPFITVITINRNNAEGLESTLRSVCAQDFPDFEYIVIDGDSTDGSQQKVEQYKSFVKEFISEKDKGIYDAMNKGIKRASGDYLVFLNSGDSFVDANVLTKVHQSAGGEDLLSGNILFLEKSGLRQDHTPEKLTKFYLLHSMLYHPVTFIRKSLFDRFGLYNDQLRIVGDYEFFLRAMAQSKITYKHLPFNVAVFDNSGISASEGTRLQMLNERSAVQKKYFNPLLLLAWRIYKGY